MRHHHLGPLALIALVLVVASCGREAPLPGNLEVTSDPDGAAIALDGKATPYVTPHTFTDVEGGTYNVAVTRGDLTVQRDVTVLFGATTQTHFEFALGSLEVTSSPDGAEIIIDGADSGVTTPHVFDDMLVGTYTVSVTRTGFDADPVSTQVDVTAGATANADFSLSIRRVVLFEGFSNVHCTGCPAFNADVQHVMEQPAYGPDRMLYIKWVGPVPTPLDPFYLAAQAMMDARGRFYNASGAFNHPSLFIDGTLAGGFGSPPDTLAMKAAVAQEATSAGAFRISIAEPDFDGLAVEATVTLDLPETIDLSAHTLNVVLIYPEVETHIAFEGIDTFHDVVRAHAVATTDLGSLDAGLHPYTVTLVDPDPDTNPLTALTPSGKAIVAFVQRNADKVVVQAGSTLTNTVRGTAPVLSTARSGR